MKLGHWIHWIHWHQAQLPWPNHGACGSPLSSSDLSGWPWGHGSGAALRAPGEPWEPRHFEGNEVSLNEAARIHWLLLCLVGNWWLRSNILQSQWQNCTRPSANWGYLIYICLKKKRPFVLPSCLPCVALIAWHGMICCSHPATPRSLQGNSHL